MKAKLWILIGMIFFLSTARAQEESRIIGIGDLHGSMEATLFSLKLAGVLSEDGKHWAGGKTIVVQVGDILDKHDEDREVFDFLLSLQREAQQAGGALIIVLGNHEFMNVQGDLSYVTIKSFMGFKGIDGIDLSDPRLSDLPEFKRWRKGAFLPGGPYAKVMADWPLYVDVKGNVFVHGGILPKHLGQLEEMRAQTRAWLLGKREIWPEHLKDSDGPAWTRIYSQKAPDAQICKQLEEVLRQKHWKRMIVGHTMHKEGIQHYCNGQLWWIDTGLSSGGAREVLEIHNDQVKILGREKKDQ